MELFLHITTFIVALALVMRAAERATKYATSLADSFHLSKYTVGFLVVAVISILPETFISLSSALNGIPEFGLGTLFGSNVADLTLVFALTTFVVGRGLKIESRIVKYNYAYPWILVVPLVLGLDGYFSRLDGLALLVIGFIFYYLVFRNGHTPSTSKAGTTRSPRTIFLLVLSMLVLMLGAYFIVTSATAMASHFGVNPVLIGMLVVGLGTTIPELLFSIKSARADDDALGVGDVLGTVLADATIVVGILALISPFSFPVTIVYIAGAFMVAGAFILMLLMRTGRILTRKEGIVLVIVWILFATIEFIVNHGKGV